ncbi:MAG TPA: tRNA (adenosine(37)-N6)-dimethylallyltransferase MiaA [Bacteroidia bacterium]|nr:tRNA (adenosine(37)-N6)-dimethylallyltransferase MiaA [Bacteroidia bacterium]
MPEPLLVVVAGPTASGKTALAVSVARHFNTVVVSADSRQFYQGIAIGTAQPDETEKGGVTHYFIGDMPLEEHVSAGLYAAKCRTLLDKLFRNHTVVVLTGGSGLYIDAVLNGIDTFPDADPSIRIELNRMYHHEGITALQEELKSSDPEYYSQVDLNNPRRLIRALEVCRASGTPYSSFRGKDATPLPYRYIMAAIAWPRELLYNRINTRVDRMVAGGLKTEASALYAKRNLNALQTVGYTEYFQFLDGTLTEEAAIELIKKNSRNYAKRQMTWMKRHPETVWFESERTDAVISRIQSVL